ncbi:MAG: hypothetical protein COT74_04250 [Bdellovibrionales bacterium CG10_big_fil_rev_8_21_14_0_10_45_34]|nr:MAG: hypothetical protein COT74_04250 [Bdellovibrionales bacterium CG10_big_fil_rev_8_21_14_0_10_45_34]
MKKNTILNILAGLATFALGTVAFGQEEAVAAAVSSAGDLKALGIGLALGMAAIGGTIGQGIAASAALGGIARNPSAQANVFTPLLLSLVFMETIVLFAFVAVIIKVV